MWDLAPYFHAALVFAEHRYYGDSKPYGKQSYTVPINFILKTDQDELGFCSPGTEIPVIAFGGSYGGMLAAWFRMKYPHVIDGAWASSAPMKDFYEAGIEPDHISNITATTYVNSGCDRKVFSEGFIAIRKLSKTGKLDYNCFTNNCTSTLFFQNIEEEIAWNWQCCTSLTTQNCDRGGDNDFFLNNCDDLNDDIENCVTLFKNIGYSENLYRSRDLTIRYGMMFNATGNIIFSNGNLDPWSAGGVYENSSDNIDTTEKGIYTFYMLDAAHHLDLRTPSTCDPPSVTYERFQVVNIIKCWIYKNCTKLPPSLPLPDNKNWQVPENCQFINYGYPWGYMEPKKSQQLISSILLIVMAATSAIVITHFIA
ncbi:Lysosomal Pro-X carboxypeptidase [Dirofilaria immitis]|nr:Lysosomal Pro-X carboxypeptidase [Dirofilaria immitis]